jgi:Tol biopolymer transport system component
MSSASAPLTQAKKGNSRQNTNHGEDSDGLLTAILFLVLQEMGRTRTRTVYYFSSDGKSVYYEHTDSIKEIRRLLFRNLKTGDEKEIYRPFYENNDRFKCALSPDGKQFVLQSFERNDNLLVMHILPASGGEIRELYRCEYSESFSLVLTWSKDGKYILFSNVVPDQEKKLVPTFHLLRIPAEGGEPQALDLKMVRMENLSIHPDGKTMAFFSFGATMRMPNLWKMENFLPESLKKK